MKKHLWIALLFAAALVIGGCSSGNDNNQEADNNTAEESNQDADNNTNSENNNNEASDDNKITIGYNQWPARIATANVWKILLEDEGYDVELQPGSKGPLFTGLSDGDIDILSQVWLPFADKDYAEEYEDDIVQHDKWYEEAPLGLVVPEYVDIDSIDELNAHVDELNGEIVGIEPGASLMQLTEEAQDDYDLDYELTASSDSAMMSSLKEAYEDEEPILVTLWEPHWAFASYDLKILDDPKNTYGDPDDIYWFSRTDFKEDHPKVAKYFDQWDMSHEDMSSLMNTIRDIDDPEEGAQEWIDDNQDTVDEWVK